MIKNYLCVVFLFFFVNESIYAQQTHQDGQWGSTISLEIAPTSLANLPDGKLLIWASSSANTEETDIQTFTQIIDPFTGAGNSLSPRTITPTNHQMLCPSINNLADGSILVSGGNFSLTSSVYNTKEGVWKRVEDMIHPRGYQGATTLADGSVFVMGGSWSGGEGSKNAEIWTNSSGWRLLTGLNDELLWRGTDSNNAPQELPKKDNHAWLWAAPNGKVFHAGPGEMMHWLDVAGNGSAQGIGRRSDDRYSISGTTVMFDLGKIFKAGGSYYLNNGAVGIENSYIIDINDENNVNVTPAVNTMEHSKIMTSSVVLPNGEVVILGGKETSSLSSNEADYITAEIFNPQLNSFRTVNSTQISSAFYNTAVLLSDGRIFMGGADFCDNCTESSRGVAKIYSPPYLFNSSGNLAARPSLNAPEKALYNEVLPVQASPNIMEFSFVRMSSTTHNVNNEQRRVPISFSGSDGTYELNIPDANIMPPGYYMLFALDSNGVPSISQVVQVGTTAIFDNLALNQPTSQSSVGYGAVSSLAVDGNIDGWLPNSITHTEDGDNDTWWRVDLGAVYDLSTIRVYNRVDCCAERLTGATLYVGTLDSSNPIDYTQAATLSERSIQTYTDNLGRGRYIMIRQSGILSLLEVQAYGRPVTCPAAGTPCDDGNTNTYNDVQDGTCNCAGTVITCDALEVAYDVNGQIGSGSPELNLVEGDNITLSLNITEVPYTVIAPDGTTMEGNSITNITASQAGLYQLITSLGGSSSEALVPTIAYVNSEDTAGGDFRAVNALDGNVNTFWHTQWFAATDTYPHELHIDLGAISQVSGLEYLPRQDGNPNGTIANYAIYVSQTTSNWGTAVATGTWENNTNLKTVTFTEKTGRYVMLVALSEVNGNPYASAAEINVMSTPSTTCINSLQVNVIAKDIPVTGVTLDTETATLLAGETQTLLATVSPANATNQLVSWSSTDEAIATVDANGVVTAVASGTVNITVTTEDGGFSSSALVQVEEPINPPSDVTVLTAPNPADAILYAYFSSPQPLVMVALNIYDAAGKLVKTFDDPASIFVEGDNYRLLVNDIPVGTYTLEGVSTTGTYSKEIIIARDTVPLTGISLGVADVTVAIGESFEFNPIFEPVDASNQTLVWSSSDSSIATVDSNGIVVGLIEGLVSITATSEDGGFTATAIVTVTAEPASNVEVLIAPNPADAIVYVYFSTTESLEIVTLNIYDSANNLVKVFNNPGAFLVEGDNYRLLVNDLPVGTYTVEGVSTTGSYTSELRIVREIVPITGLDIATTEVSMVVGEQYYIARTIIPADATATELVWTSSDASVASVDSNGNVTAVSVGEAQITAATQDGNLTVSVTITVTDIVMLIAPNPATFVFYVYFYSPEPLEIISINIYDQLGRLVKTFNNPTEVLVEGGNYRLVIEDLPAGNYIIEGVTSIGRYQKQAIIE